MNTGALVTIVIPVYNGASYVGEAIQSALDQTYQNIEVIVVDDGSTDSGATRAAVEPFATRVQYIHKENGGVATALNTGISHMRGEYFSWLSHDDLYLPLKVERQVEALNRFGRLGIVIGDYENIGADKNESPRAPIEEFNLIARPLDAIFRGLIDGCALLVPAQLFHSVGLFAPGLPTTQDYHLWYRMALRVPFVYCAHADVRHRIHPGQGSRSSAHLDEASRMFIHLLDSTPVGLMKAYDGSELRFLLRTRRNLMAYEGLQAYLSRRISELKRTIRYSFVLAGNSEPPSSGLAAPAVEVVRSANAGLLDLLRAAEVCDVDLVVIVFTGRSPTAIEVDTAIESLLEANADIAIPWEMPDPLAVRLDALPGLMAVIDKCDFDINAIARVLRTARYIASTPLARSDPGGSLSSSNLDKMPDQLREECSGDSIMAYAEKLGRVELGAILANMLQNALPVLLILTPSILRESDSHVKSLAGAIRGKVNPLICCGMSDGDLCLSFSAGNFRSGIVFRLPGDFTVLLDILTEAGVARADVHHAGAFAEGAAELLEGLGVPFDVTLLDRHDAAAKTFSGQGDGPRPAETDLADGCSSPFPENSLALLRRASRRFALSRQLAADVQRRTGGLTVIPVRPWHEKGVLMRHVFPPSVRSGEPLRVLVAGDVAAERGGDLLVEVIVNASLRKLPLRFHLLGRLSLPAEAKPSDTLALTVEGPYDPDRFIKDIGRIGPHVGWIPYQAGDARADVFREFVRAGLPFAGSGCGEFPERCYGRPYTWLLPCAANFAEWINLFLQLHASSLGIHPRWLSMAGLPPFTDLTVEEYLKPMVQ